jgi:hypothetical protein
MRQVSSGLRALASMNSACADVAKACFDRLSTNGIWAQHERMSV